MNYVSERNERKVRQQALVLAVSLHLAMVGMLYFKMTSEAQGNTREATPTVKPAKVQPSAQLMHRFQA